MVQRQNEAGIMTMRACGAPKTGQDVSRLAIGKDESGTRAST